MKVKTKKVYYCDFCGKHSLMSLEFHERHCTANPNRKCRLCNTENITDIINKYNNRYRIVDTYDNLYRTQKVEWLNGEVKFEDIMEDVGECPVCALTVLRVCRLNIFPLEVGSKFDFKEELKRWWSEKNSEIETYF